MTGMAVGGLLGAPTAFNLWAASPSIPGPDVHNEITDASLVEFDGTSGSIVRRDRDGLFRVAVRVNGAPLRCLVDTGSSSITLSQKQADRLGAQSASLVRVGRLTTATGTLVVRRLQLQSVELMGHHFKDVSAVVVPGAQTPCLLGVEVLAHMDDFQLQGDQLMLR